MLIRKFKEDAIDEEQLYRLEKHNHYFYHGSSRKGIKSIWANSRLHGTNQDVVYLTDNLCYALMYIWDENRLTTQKHVTCGIKNGIVMYEEQFPNQLETFYRGVKGYIYCVKDNANISVVENRENMAYSLGDTKVDEVIEIDDVYEMMLQYEEAGLLKISHFNDLSQENQQEMTKHIAAYIQKMNYFKDNKERAKLMETYFTEAWQLANND